VAVGLGGRVDRNDLFWPGGAEPSCPEFIWVVCPVLYWIAFYGLGGWVGVMGSVLFVLLYFCLILLYFSMNYLVHIYLISFLSFIYLLNIFSLILLIFVRFILILSELFY
jgi:hypothetical protein